MLRRPTELALTRRPSAWLGRHSRTLAQARLVVPTEPRPLGVQEAKRASGRVEGTKVGSTRECCRRGDEDEIAAAGVQRGDHDSPESDRARPGEGERRCAGERRIWERVRRSTARVANRDHELRPLLKVRLVRSRRENVEPLGLPVGEDVGLGRVDRAGRRGTRQVDGGQRRAPTARATGKHKRVLVTLRDERRGQPRGRRRNKQQRRDKDAERWQARQPSR